jgi:molybdopterin molybdotransferase
LLAGIGGRSIEDALRWRTMPLLSTLGECGSRETFHRGRSQADGVDILGSQDSSAQKALAAADLLVRQRAGDPALHAGDAVEVVDF